MKQILHKSFALKAFMLVAMMVSAITGAWAEKTAGFTISKAPTASEKSGTFTGTQDEIWNWVVNTSSTDYSSSLNTGFWQIGKNGGAAESATFSTSGISGTISKIVVACSSYNALAKVSATVGGSDFGTQEQSTTKWTTTGNVTFDGSASGEIVITLTNGTNGRAMYIKSITVTYEDGTVDTREEVTLSFPAESYEATIGEDFTTPQLTVNPSEAASEVVFSSSNTKVATVSEDGTVTLVGPGSSVISAEIANSTNYLDASASYTLNVTKIYTVEDGVFNFEAKFSDYGSGVETTTDGSFYIEEDKTWTAGKVTLVSSGKYRWWDNDGTLRFYNAVGSGMTISVPNGYVITSIVITGGQAFAANVGEYASGTWTGSAQSVTLAYAAEKSVNVKTVTVIYEAGTAVNVPVPTFNPEAGEVVAGTTVEIICPDEAEGIEYSFDQLTWNEVTEPFTISEATTIYARAYDIDGNLSSVVSASYTIKEETPAYETVTFPYSVDFTKTQDKFVIEDKELSGLTYVWKRDSKYGMKASAYNKMNYVSESWLVSPLIDLTTNTGAADLSFEHATNLFNSIENAIAEATVWVRTESGQWTKLEVNYPEALGWDFVQGGTVDLSSYNGNKIQIGFKYVSSLESCGTWEIKNFTIQAGEVVEKLEAGLSYSAANYTATIGEENEFPVLANPNSLTVTYSSTNESVATVDEEGNITLLAAGQTTIKATSEEDDTYAAGSASYLLVVKDQEVAGTDKYELVTDASTLKDGDIIVIAFVGDIEETTHYEMALSTTQNNNNRAANEVTVNEDGTITPGSSIQQITLEGETDAWYFNVGNGYLYAASKSSNQLKTETEADDNAKAAISISDNNATILFQGNNTHNDLRFNPNTQNGAPLFSCYTSTTSMSLPQIYRKVASETPAVEGDVNNDGKVTIADVTALVNIILGHPGEGVNTDAADVNGDDKTTIADVTALVNLILKQ